MTNAVTGCYYSGRRPVAFGIDPKLSFSHFPCDSGSFLYPSKEFKTIEGNNKMDADPNLPVLTIGALTAWGLRLAGLKGRNKKRGRRNGPKPSKEAQVARENATTGR